MSARRQRFALIAIGLLALSLATYLVLSALGGNLSYFFSPTEVAQGNAPEQREFRLGGMVKEGSVKRDPGDLTVTFVVTDHNQAMKVSYTGILPDLFDEGQGVIAQGKLNSNGVFLATEVLAKHDENYMPPEVADALNAGQINKMKRAAK